MTKKIFRAMFLASMAVLLATMALILGVLFQYFRNVQLGQLRSEMNLAAAAVEMEGLRYLQQVNAENCRLTWVDADGTVLFDSQGDVQAMENHGQREEIQEAAILGAGESFRYSTTLTEDTLYYARRLQDGTVLRMSVRFASVPTLVLGILQQVALVFLLALGLSLVLSRRLSRRLVQPFNDIDLDHPLENDTYDELSPLLIRMEKQRQKIAAQGQELLDKQSEFYTVIENMEEGLVLLNKANVVLSINPAAAAFFQAGDAVGRDLIEIERSPEIVQAVAGAAQQGSRTLEISRGGREYQLNINRIQSEGEVSGVVILIFDSTEKVFAQRNRKEFTANVSHELKTPLHSILGSAELLENGLVKEADVPRFIGHIRQEASRLVALIEDIIRLSQLDEYAAPEPEAVDLLALAREVGDLLRPAAEEKQVSLTVEGQAVTLTGVRQLLQEILYNLCDNAIKYNVEGGSVRVRVSEGAEGVSLSVRDTGIGIPAEHHARIFERFYRVDKSHSKQTGGTGLGLSIVKHAAQYMGGRIRLESTPGTGTTITVLFPKK